MGKPDVFESQNSPRHSFLNAKSLISDFGACQSLLESHFPDTDSSPTLSEFTFMVFQPI